VPLDEVGGDPRVIGRVVVNVDDEVIGEQLEGRTDELGAWAKVITIAVDYDLGVDVMESLGNLPVPFGEARVLVRDVEPDLVAGLPGEGLEDGLDLIEPARYARETDHNLHGVTTLLASKTALEL
jgi:hypothetical protein